MTTIVLVDTLNGDDVGPGPAGARPLRVIAAAIVEDGRLLLTSKAAAPGVFYLPGGKPDGQETAEACLRRELREELTVDCRVGDHLVDVRAPATLEGIDMYMSVYRCALLGPPVVAAEIAALCWWTPTTPIVGVVAPVILRDVAPSVFA